MDNDLEVVRTAAKEIALLDAEIKELTERRDALKSYFKDGEKYPPGEHNMGNGVLVKVTTNQRISQKKAEEKLSRSMLEQISALKVDTKKARALLTPHQLDVILDQYDHRIEVKIMEEEAW